MHSMTILELTAARRFEGASLETLAANSEWNVGELELIFAQTIAPLSIAELTDAYLYEGKTLAQLANASAWNERELELIFAQTTGPEQTRDVVRQAEAAAMFARLVRSEGPKPAEA
jgi:hypothetical protein